MKIRGAQVFQDLRASLDDVHADAARIRADYQRLDARMKSVVDERGVALLELAKHYVPAISREAVENSFAEIRGELAAIVERKERRVQELSDRIGRLRDAAAAGQVKFDAAAASAKQAADTQAAVQSELSKRLAENTEFQDFSKRALEAEAELQRDEERITEIRREAKEKLPAYERSSLFRYLQEQRFGTPDYTHRGLTRRLDRWVASLISYSQARPSYNFLQVTPAIMEQETARRKEEFNHLMDRIESIEQQTATELRLSESVRNSATTAADRDRLSGLLTADQERVRSADQERAALDQAQGQFYEEAIARLRNFLARAKTSLLQARAMETPDKVDDDIVMRLRILEDELTDLEPRIGQLTADSQAADKRSEGMEFVVRRFEQSNFHDVQSFFEDGFDVMPLVAQYRAGAFDKDAFLQQLKRAQERVPTELERRAGEAAKNMMNSPLTGALVEAMVTVAGAALTTSVGRSVDRRRPFTSSSPQTIDSKPVWVKTNRPNGK
jgi:hypothetical protein